MPYQYKVVELREKWLGGKMSGEKLERVLNDYAAQGWQVVNMTQMPEAALAAESGIPYAGIALVTDYDVGLEGAPGITPVTIDEVFAAFA